MMHRGGGDGLGEPGDCPVQVRQLSGALEPDPQRGPEVGQIPRPVGVAGRGGGDGLTEVSDGNLEELDITGPLVVPDQGSPAVGQIPRPVGVAGRGGGDGLTEVSDGNLEELDITGPLVVPDQGSPAVISLGSGDVGGRVLVGQVRSYGLRDQVGRHPQQHSRPLQATPQILLALLFGKELIANPVHGEQHTHGLDDFADGCISEIRGNGLSQLPGQTEGRGVQYAGQVARILNCPQPLGQLLDQLVRVSTPRRIADGHMVVINL